MAFRIGEVVPVERGRGIWRTTWQPAWFIFITAPQAETAAEAWLRRNGCEDCWFPSEERWRASRGRRRKVAYLAPIVPRYLFARLPMEPHWDVLFAEARGKITRVVSRDGIPLPVPEAAILQMQHLPERLAVIRETARRAAEIRRGDRAMITAGPLSGWIIDVAGIHGGIARAVLPLLGGTEVEISEANLKKLQGLA